MKNSCTKIKENLKKKLLKIANLSLLDRRCELSIKIPNYKSRESRLPNLRNPFSLFKNKNPQNS